MPATEIDLENIVAIDVHTHVQASVEAGRGFPEDSPEAAVAEVFGSDALLTVPELAAFYRERKMAAVCFMVDSVRWGGPVTNEEILELSKSERDVLLPFVSVDPHRGAAGVKEARRLIEEHDVRGFKFHPTLQHFFPDDPLAYPLYALIAEYKLPAVFHTGQTAVGSGQPSGGGMLLKYSNPIHLDQVAADFPDMTIIMAHPSVPWQDEALSVAVHKPNVYIDLSGWSPKYFPPQLVHYANSLLKRKVLFGTDYPALTPERWIADFETLKLRDEVRPLILKENAIRMLGLASGLSRTFAGIRRRRYRACRPPASPAVSRYDCRCRSPAGTIRHPPAAPDRPTQTTVGQAGAGEAQRARDVHAAEPAEVGVLDDAPPRLRQSCDRVVQRDGRRVVAPAGGDLA